MSKSSKRTLSNTNALEDDMYAYPYLEGYSTNWYTSTNKANNNNNNSNSINHNSTNANTNEQRKDASAAAVDGSDAKRALSSSRSHTSGAEEGRKNSRGDGGGAADPGGGDGRGNLDYDWDSAYFEMAYSAVPPPPAAKRAKGAGPSSPPPQKRLSVSDPHLNTSTCSANGVKQKGAASDLGGTRGSSQLSANGRQPSSPRETAAEQKGGKASTTGKASKLSAKGNASGKNNAKKSTSGKNESSTSEMNSKIIASPTVRLGDRPAPVPHPPATAAAPRPGTSPTVSDLSQQAVCNLSAGSLSHSASRQQESKLTPCNGAKSGASTAQPPSSTKQDSKAKPARTTVAGTSVAPAPSTAEIPATVTPHNSHPSITGTSAAAPAGPAKATPKKSIGGSTAKAKSKTPEPVGAKRAVPPPHKRESASAPPKTPNREDADLLSPTTGGHGTAKKRDSACHDEGDDEEPPLERNGLPAQTYDRASVAENHLGARFLNDYLLLQDVGRGASGKVLLAYSLAKNRKVAIKVINKPKKKRYQLSKCDSAFDMDQPPNSPFGAAELDRKTLALQREIDVMKSIHHENIVALYEVIDDPHSNKLYLVMQFVDNGPIASIDSDGNLSARLRSGQLAQLATQISSGLHYLHRHHVVHRDIKPENILVATNGVAYLADFGVAEMLERDNALPTTVDNCGFQGTPLFMPPEIYTRAEDLVDLTPEETKARMAIDPFALDVWALGVTFLALLTGKVPFTSITDIRTAAAQGCVRLPATVPEEWRALLQGMLQCDPRQRLDIRAVRQHVKQIAATLTQRGDTGSLATPLRPPDPLLIFSPTTESENNSVRGSNAGLSQRGTAPTMLAAPAPPPPPVAATDFNPVMDDSAADLDADAVCVSASVVPTSAMGATPGRPGGVYTADAAPEEGRLPPIVVPNAQPRSSVTSVNRTPLVGHGGGNNPWRFHAAGTANNGIHTSTRDREDSLGFAGGLRSSGSSRDSRAKRASQMKNAINVKLT